MIKQQKQKVTALPDEETFAYCDGLQLTWILRRKKSHYLRILHYPILELNEKKKHIKV
jgi:hypothetical protein